MTEDAMRGERACKTCMWFEPRVKGSYIRGDGWCKYRPPPASREWGKYIDPVAHDDWCSCWLWNPGS